MSLDLDAIKAKLTQLNKTDDSLVTTSFRKDNNLFDGTYTRFSGLW